MPSKDFWRGKRVLLTGHTGFKGAWAWMWLEHLGAEVSGLALASDTSPNLAGELGIAKSGRSLIGDIRDAEAVKAAVAAANPTFVLHMAAQALVRRSYREPVETFDTNVRGTLQVLQALRSAPALTGCVVVTSDKVYENDDRAHSFVEDDRLGGSDPYSASKAACEVATSSFARSYFGPLYQGKGKGMVATARAGNVIGGGDWSEDRLVPDLWRAQRDRTVVELRHPEATRPWQHVLEPISGYLRLLESMERPNPAKTLNFGPDDAVPVTVREVVEQFQASYGRNDEAGWTLQPGQHPKEAKTLAITPAKARETLGWRPRLSAREAIEWTASWYAGYDRGADPRVLTMDQIKAYEKRGH